MRKLELIDMWYDMEIVLQTRGPEIISYAEDCWGLRCCPDEAILFNSLKSYFIDTDKPPGLRGFYLGDRYVYDLFKCYTYQKPYGPSFGVPANVMREVLNRIYHRKDWKFWMEGDVCGRPQNVLVSLYVVRIGRHLDEELASFDWHSMHDTCQEFFDNLRQTIGNLCFSEFGSKSRSTSPSTARLPDSNDSDIGGSSLEALYHLIFAADLERRQENMILAALCLNASEISHCKIQNREYMIERWANGITKHAEELNISLLLAGDVLQKYISEKRDVHMSDAAVRL